MIMPVDLLTLPEVVLCADEAGRGRMIALCSSAYRLAVCALGRERGAEEVVLRSYREVFEAGITGLTEREQLVVLLRAVIRHARRGLGGRTGGAGRGRRRAHAKSSRFGMPVPASSR
jgi:hypothetical protein